MKPGVLTVFSGTVVLITSMLGAGTIFMPRAVMNLGQYNFIIFFSVIAFLSFVTLYLISFVANKFSKENPDKELSYYSITSNYSKVLGTLVDAFLIIQGVGSCILYTRTVVDWIFLIFKADKESKQMFVWVIIGGFSTLVTMIASLKSLSALKYAQYVSVSTVLFLLGLCGYYSIFLDCEMNNKDGDQSLVRDNIIKNSYEGISAFVFAIGCHQNIVQVFSELKKRTMSNIALISGLCITAGFSIYSLIGFLGYYLVGNSIGKMSILEFMLQTNNNFGLRMQAAKNSTIFVKIGSVAFLTVMLCAFPMQMHPVRNGFLNLVSLNKAMKQKIHERPDPWRIGVTVSFCVLVAFVSALTMSQEKIINRIVSIVAATAGCSTIYIIPGLLYCMCERKLSSKVALSGMVSAFGVLMSMYLLFNIGKEIKTDSIN